MTCSSPGLKLLGTQRVGNVLNGVTETVGEVVGGIDTPGVPGMGVRCVLNAVGHWVLLTVLHNVLHTKCSLQEKLVLLLDFRDTFCVNTQRDRQTDVSHLSLLKLSFSHVL